MKTIKTIILLIIAVGLFACSDFSNPISSENNEGDSLIQDGPNDSTPQEPNFSGVSENG